MVEMAFVIFLLVLLVFGITEFGRAMYTKNTLNNAARAGARVAVVTAGINNCSSAGLASPCAGDGPVFTAIDNSIVAAIDKSTVNVTVSASDTSGIASLKLEIDGIQVAAGTTEQLVYSRNISAITAGSHNLVASATDASSTANSKSTTLVVTK